MSGDSGVQSLDRAFGLLEALSLKPEGMHLMELATATGLHKSTVHRLLSALTQLGYVKKSEPGEGKYRLTLKLFELSGRIADSIDVLSTARLSLESLRDAVQETVNLMLLENSEIVYIFKAESHVGSFRMFSRIGTRRPLYCTAAGKSILATMPDDEVERIWRSVSIKAYTQNTIVELDDLYRDLEIVRSQGYAVDNEENELGVRCIAAAIKDYTGRSQAAFSVSVPIVRMSDARIRELAAQIVAASSEISAQLGYNMMNDSK